MIEAYKKVVKTIETAHYKHLQNGSVIKLISNFYTIYKEKGEYEKLLSLYEHKLSLINNND